MQVRCLKSLTRRRQYYIFGALGKNSLRRVRARLDPRAAARGHCAGQATRCVSRPEEITFNRRGGVTQNPHCQRREKNSGCARAGNQSRDLVSVFARLSPTITCISVVPEKEVNFLNRDNFTSEIETILLPRTTYVPAFKESSVASYI